MPYELINTEGRPIKAWTIGVPFEDEARAQLRNVAALPIVHKWVAAMPDVHWGRGATVGSVIPTRGAIIPAAVGVDIGCGMMATRTSLTAADLPDSLKRVRSAIEKAVPHGRTVGKGARKLGFKHDEGAWRDVPDDVLRAWRRLSDRFDVLAKKHRVLQQTNNVNHLGTLGTGNHFIELCLDESDQVWAMLHSGSRGVGNRIGTYFIELAKADMGHLLGQLPDVELAYLTEGTEHFDAYVEALQWAQDYAHINRQVMMQRVLDALREVLRKPFKDKLLAVNCHHNYVAREQHYGEELLITRKGAVRAGVGELGIIPGSMGARSYIVRGLGHPESFDSCSHGAGRAMSRTQARQRISVDDHIRATLGIECRKDDAVLDESPAAYKSIDAVMAAQQDLVEIVHTLRQVVCVKG